MILFCRYGTVDGAPEKGVVLAWHDEAGAPPASTYPGTIAVPYAGAIETLDRFGPPPSPMGAPPSPNHADDDLLDMLGVPLTIPNASGVDVSHPLRVVAGTPRDALEDNRAVALDMRPWAAPDLTLEVARSAALYAVDRSYAEAHDAGFTSDALGSTHLYESTEAAFGKLQMAGLASLGGQKKAGWTASIVCAKETEKPGAFSIATSVPHTAAQVQSVVGDYQAFDDGLQAKRDRLRAEVAATSDVAGPLAVVWN